ncbi:protein naked cuticle homolog 2 [Halichoeres trimaculatus]|uniref:protein naked cuticle homolog 2 n=1 Tax=Halichoeres trimaculatus TaxID=147232 RepID=UPI003D9F6F0A
MGKFQSKFALKRRQSPEGGSLTSNVLTCQQELEQIHIHKLTENLFLELREIKSGSSRDPKVTLSPKKRPDKRHSLHLQVRKQTKKRSSHVVATECNLKPDEDAQQEWVFTLHDFDNKKGKSSLVHSIYEVLEESVKQPYNTPFPLRIKLVVMPSLDSEKTSELAEKKAGVSGEASARGLYCVDENIERRNHYMDLAGIENFSSKFEDTESPSMKSRHKAHSALQHHQVVIRENYTTPDSPRGLSNPGFQKSKTISVGKERNGGYRLHRPQSASCCHHVPHSQPAAQRTHSRRLRSKGQDAAFSPYLSCKAPASPAQRHEHHHQHEHHHHHHHHHHHYRPS